MFRPFDLISKEYVGEQRTLHARPNGYGGKGNKWATGVFDLAKAFDCFSILDYGCGQGMLVAALKAMGAQNFRLDEYDPAVPGKDQLPSFADLVVCTDVLEHIEPEKLVSVVRHLDMLARKAIYLVVATRPSNKTLSDGRNAHLTIEPAEWWEAYVTQVIKWQIHSAASSEREWVAVLTP